MSANYETITLAGGCFWCLEAVFDEVKGVLSVDSGYSNGHLANPTYRQVCSGNSGHAEVAAEVKGAGNIPCYQRIPYGPGWALVGDSQQVLDPWSGMGIDHATTHASNLVDSLHRFLTDAAAWDATMSDHHAQARRWSEKTYRRTSTYAADLRPMTRAALQKRGLI